MNKDVYSAQGQLWSHRVWERREAKLKQNVW